MIGKLAVIFLAISLSFIYLSLPQKYLNLVSPIKTASLISYDTKPKDIFIPNLPSVNQIFGSDHTWIATLSAQNIRTMIATGDIIPARSVNYQVLARHDFKWPYLKTASIVKNADIVFANLESPLIDKCPTTQEGMVFCGDKNNIEGLLFAGINIVSLANNHAGNYGPQGVEQTTKLLNENNILVTGVHGPTIADIKGIKFAFLGYNDITKSQPGVSNVDEEIIKQEIAEAKKQADLVIVTLHWGTEYKDLPDDRQRYLGHIAVDAGADLIVGNHPHWIQPVEIYKGKLITYAHGNFVFDQMWSQKTKEGVIGKYIFYDKQLIDVEFMPVQIADYGQPFFLEGAQVQAILTEMKVNSLKLQ